MCTVSLIARRNGYALAMNRDEKRTRAMGLPPSLRIVDGIKVLCPSEPGGGTWIAINEHGVTYALINWYSVKAKVESNALSRGDVVTSVATLDNLESASGKLRDFPLSRTNPFRLIGVFPRGKRIVEWRWNLEELRSCEHPWNSRQWISSGFDEPTAQEIRSATFRAARDKNPFGTPAWLRRLHRSHGPECGPFSTCMHREDAATVSYTEIAVSGSRAQMLHAQGPPCEDTPRHMFHLKLNREKTNTKKNGAYSRLGSNVFSRTKLALRSL